MDIVQIKQIMEHTETISDAWYSHDAAMLATASADKTVKIWSTDATLTPQKTDGVGLLPDAHIATRRLGVLAVMASKWRPTIVCWL
jgi:WD40 repeat protein